jgi:hypothetical protein
MQEGVLLARIGRKGSFMDELKRGSGVIQSKYDVDCEYDDIVKEGSVEEDILMNDESPIVKTIDE